ncbi:MAG: DUF5916 domain-containing protein [Vicinamibacterales bacterium]
MTRACRPVCAAAGLLLLVCASATAAAGQVRPSRPAGEAPPPVPPAVVSRDAAGHVTMRAVRVSGPFRIDGRLDERAYAETEAVGDFLQQEPNEGQPATERTESWVFFDDNNIYVSARCWDTHPERMVANEMRRDTNQLRQNDTFAVLFDTYHDRRNAYLFYANPIGGFADSQITDENPPNVDWNTIWEVKTARFEQGWTIEMAIPFKSLRYGPGRDQTWGINLRRVVRWKNEWSHLTQIPRALTTFRGILKVSSAATLVGLQAPPVGPNIEVKPYGISSLTTDNTARPVVTDDLAARLGGDVKYGITPNFTADFTVRTDFAQVEVDEQQVNLTRFNLFFPEKRDFFLEGQGIFAFAGRQSAGLNAGAGDTPYLFFSRRIGLDAGRSIPIQAGGRLTGKTGKVSIGALNVQTAEQDAASVPTANVSVLRVKRDILRRSAVGAMFTHRTALVGRAGSNDGYGVDAAFGFFQNLRMDGYLARTRTDGRDGGDTSYRGFLDYNADRYGVQFERLEVGRNFNPEVGFVRRLDMRRNYALFRFSPRPKRIPRVRRMGFQGSLNYTTNTTNRLDTRQAVLQFQTEFTNSDVAIASFTPQFERLVAPFAIATGIRIPVGGYDYHTTHLEYQAGQQRRYSGTVLFETGTFYSGTKRSFGVSGARVQVTPQMSLEPSMQVDWVDLKEGRFTAKVVRTRATYTLTPRIYVSGIVQYNSTTASIGSNLRLRWEYRPGSEVFVVYTDDYDTVDRPAVPGLRNRAFVLKVNRLLRF